MCVCVCVCDLLKLKTGVPYTLLINVKLCMTVRRLEPFSFLALIVYINFEQQQ